MACRWARRPRAIHRTGKNCSLVSGCRRGFGQRRSVGRTRERSNGGKSRHRYRRCVHFERHCHRCLHQMNRVQARYVVGRRSVDLNAGTAIVAAFPCRSPTAARGRAARRSGRTRSALPKIMASRCDAMAVEISTPNHRGAWFSRSGSIDDERRAEVRAQHRAHAADDDHEQQVERQIDIECQGFPSAEVEKPPQGARDAA